jgi:hypothetical protein
MIIPTSIAIVTDMTMFIATSTALVMNTPMGANTAMTIAAAM